MPEQIKSDFYAKIKVHLGGLCAIFGTILLHSIIGLRYPALFLDEFYYGTRAWAFFRSFTDPINYRIIYNDHPPFGWLIMGLSCALMVGVPWMIRVRIFMIILFFIQQILIYAIASKFFHRTVGVIALIINGLGSGFLIYQQMVFLDNIGIVFILGAWYLQPKENIRTSSRLILSGILCGIACAIKLPFVFFIPAFPIIYILNNKTNNNTKCPAIYYIHKIIIWVMGFMIPLILLSLILIVTGNLQYFVDGTLFQLTRSNPGATLSFYFPIWFDNSPLLILVSFIFPIFFVISGIIYGIKEGVKIRSKVNKKFVKKIAPTNPNLSDFWNNSLKISIFATCFIIFLIRGGTIYSHYILPLLAFSALLIGLVIYNLGLMITMFYEEILLNRITLKRETSQRKFSKAISIVIFTFGIMIFLYPYNYSQNTSNLIEKQYELLSWIELNIPKNSSIVVKDFFVAELYELGYKNVQIDGYIDQKSFGNDWRNIDYLIISPIEEAPFGFLSVQDASFLSPALQYTQLIYSKEIGNDKICIYIINS